MDREVCRRCGKSGHQARGCPQPKVCDRCGMRGHLGKDCTGSMTMNGPNLNHGSGSVCLRCGASGHFARECTRAAKCDFCGQPGHMQKDCAMKKASSVCSRCGATGHYARDCRSKTEPCFKCGQVGHMARDCGTAAALLGTTAGASTGAETCHNCGEVGHYARECPRGRAGGRLDNRTRETNIFQQMRKRQKAMDGAAVVPVAGPGPGPARAPDLGPWGGPAHRPASQVKLVRVRMVKPKAASNAQGNYKTFDGATALKAGDGPGDRGDGEKPTGPGSDDMAVKEGSDSGGDGLGALMGYGDSDSDEDSDNNRAEPNIGGIQGGEGEGEGEEKKVKMDTKAQGMGTGVALQGVESVVR